MPTVKRVLQNRRQQLNATRGYAEVIFGIKAGLAVNALFPAEAEYRRRLWNVMIQAERELTTLTVPG